MRKSTKMMQPERRRGGSSDIYAALAAQIGAAHEATNGLMKVQFDAVRDQFERIHTSMAALKADMQKETGRLEKEIDVNRSVTETNRALSEERHISLIKKVWYGAGIIAVFQILLQLGACHLKSPF